MNYKEIKNPFDRFTQKGAASALWMCLLLAGCFTSCLKNRDNMSQGIYYVVGYYGISQVDSLKGTAKAGGYLFVSENLKDSLFASNYIFVHEGGYSGYGDLLDGIIVFPMESMALPSICKQETFFAEEYRFAFKVQINSYRQMTEKEYKPFLGPLIALCTFYKPYRYKPVVITSISKIENIK